MAGIIEALAVIERLQQLKEEIVVCRAAAEKLQVLEQEYGSKHKQLTDCLDNMDVTARGNFGWERRIVPFLMEFKRLVEHEVKATK